MKMRMTCRPLAKIWNAANIEQRNRIGIDDRAIHVQAGRVILQSSLVGDRISTLRAVLSRPAPSGLVRE